MKGKWGKNLLNPLVASKNFETVYSLVHFRQIWQTDHAIVRKILPNIEFIYQAIQLFFTYFSLSNCYLTFYFIADGIADPAVDPFGNKTCLYIFTIMRFVCVLLICTQFVLPGQSTPGR
ncbi:uncharacterized protein CTHT_0049430 [Thermochaetoides thermophila DSM 1495]|uniref:Uncharacterized protein n=1 Tax=Chaetomium thermophilum (strain DSM 1495 / CBS 144.50 / IMI 039719) TaxID=759272 RepID=G0SB97_CHATD|nr:hypothetical protein CTHT_0049430 [Thermochaetoides thermophila DSM 1495]EGS19477.1 hypothetical protein CTHT_0049430 [Thermochaetoides thermophila DSM 1495]